MTHDAIELTETSCQAVADLRHLAAFHDLLIRVVANYHIGRHLPASAVCRQYRLDDPEGLMDLQRSPPADRVQAVLSTW